MPSTADGVNGDVGGSPASSSSTEEGPEVATAAGICAADAVGTAPAASAANGDSKPHTNGGLVSPNGTHVLWDADTRWILMFDNLLREGTRSPTKRSCGCKATDGRQGNGSSSLPPPSDPSTAVLLERALCFVAAGRALAACARSRPPCLLGSWSSLPESGLSALSFGSPAKVDRCGSYDGLLARSREEGECETRVKSVHWLMDGPDE
ncbi:hypothetical protein HPB47_005848 [Ixodes persulcatus]|uniref:Uncharacterized protein n=1 Tax=Ixodes persulcatus TaxID=34615 RepID=A0AC60PBV5_IXOPE|nr:hypothetical protein HPB47_005848 [Ixodes persulcatus]